MISGFGRPQRFPTLSPFHLHILSIHTSSTEILIVSMHVMHVVATRGWP